MKINLSDLDIPARHQRFSQYQVIDSQIALKDVIYAQNVQNYGQNHSALKPEGQEDVFIANSMKFYGEFLVSLQQSGYEFQTLETIMSAGAPVFDRQAVIRHDVDGDLPAALRCAQIERTLGISSTYFLLHTSPYYGEFVDGAFRRNEACAEIYLGIQDLGHEVGLHADALWVYQKWGMDGLECLITEINWLRSIGLRIVGTSPHNGPGVYGGLSNSEVFAGHHHYERKLFSTPVEIEANKVEGIPVRALSSQSVGLSYEADAIWDLPCVIDWLSIMNHDRNARFIWWDHADQNASQTRGYDSAKALMQDYIQRSGQSPTPVTHAEFLRAQIADAPHLLYLSIHPEYYGRRQFPMAWP